MRSVQLPGFAMAAGAIGFGCASLGSRVAPADGVRAMAEAHAAGVNWFDVAPAYGAGDAESILGTFARGRRDQLLICTKVGLAPPQRNALLKSAYAAARPLVGALKGLRKAFRRIPATRNVAVPLTPALLVESLERSLRRLGTDHVDVFALHKPVHADIARDDILQALSDLRRAGKVRHVGVAGDAHAAQLALAHPDVYTVLQLADDPVDQPLRRLQAAAAGRLSFITHSVLGVDGMRERLTQALHAGGAPAVRRLTDAGYAGNAEQTVSQLLVDRALAANAGGVVLMSMFSSKHRAANIARAEGKVRPDAIELVADLLADGGRAAR
ncbi:aldo/keto reductase [Pseudaquabacterium pictum]|uniref:NADP-dependent oxidoreductase domain-containing protein n=1 Tax=Pseudaquabacterium pictum TaxID=2315236 RepID=A0A480B269_9BURK|nr:aldo/keto reductase [Rubrivivax pictus]GCL65108.1 hypothetical protein AQPW35_41890 [Rubrivivax pictus]